MKRPKPSLLRNTLAGAWIVGGLLVVATVATGSYGVAAAAALVLVVAILATGSVSRMSLLGIIFLILGFWTLLFAIGLLIVPVGLVLYLSGLGRARVIPLWAYHAVLALVVAGVVTSLLAPDVAGALVFAAAAIVLGVGLACGHGEILGGAPRGGERST